MVWQVATTADIMGRTFQSLSWVCVGSDEEEDDAPTCDDDTPVWVGDDDDVDVGGCGFVVIWQGIDL